MWGPREVKKACRSVPSHKYPGGDATINREQRERERERLTERERLRKRETSS